MSRAEQFGQSVIEFLYHITHVRNLHSIWQHGLLSNNLASQFDPVDISDPNVQRRREKVEKIYRRPLHDYVPLYFQAMNPMLFRRREKRHELAILCVDGSVLSQPNIVFSDGNAAAFKTHFYADPKELKRLDWDCLNAGNWTDFEDGKRKRCAEVLVPESIRFELVHWILVQNDNAAAEARTSISATQAVESVLVRPDWFF